MGVRFLLDGEVIDTGDVDPTATALDYLRYRLRRTGTKEGCAEGDCGACTVLVGSLDGDRIDWRALNACILFVPQLDGKALLTVESIGSSGNLHPVQREMVERHGSQCGFCTPGFVMSLYGRSIGASGASLPVADVIAGNLCRCTGYGPILAAGEAVPAASRDDTATIAKLKTIQRETMLELVWPDPLAGTTRRAFVPRTADQLAQLLIEHPNARIVAGATDVGLWVTKQHRILDETIFIGDIPDLATLSAEPDGSLLIGAGVRYATAHAALATLHPSLGELVRRIGGLQVRNAGTIGGNIANGSPIGDMPPALIALGTELILRKGDTRRTIPLEAYFLAYGMQDRAPGEFVEAIRVPPPPSLYRVTKLSKRFDSDISAVCGAFGLEIVDGIITSARVAFGGMAATPKRATHAEVALVGQPWSEATVETAAFALAKDYQPLTDVRGSSAYRVTAAANLLRRLWIESGSDEPTNLLALTNA